MHEISHQRSSGQRTVACGQTCLLESFSFSLPLLLMRRSPSSCPRPSPLTFSGAVPSGTVTHSHPVHLWLFLLPGSLLPALKHTKSLVWDSEILPQPLVPTWLPPPVFSTLLPKYLAPIVCVPVPLPIVICLPPPPFH